MAIADLNTWLARCRYPYQDINYWGDGKSASVGTPNTPGLPLSAFIANGGVAPTTAAVPTRATAGAFGQQNSSGVMRMGRFINGMALTTTCIIVDRLSHQGGLSATTTGAQTTNLPTAALTRYTNGVGVWAGLEIYTTVGTTATTATISYTNQAGTSGQTSAAMAFGGASLFNNTRVVLMGLASGDTGVQAVASVTLAASTLTIGNFGVTLYKPLAILPMHTGIANATWDDDFFLGLGAQVAQVQTDACLQFLFIASLNTPNVPTGRLTFIEE